MRRGGDIRHPEIQTPRATGSLRESVYIYAYTHIHIYTYEFLVVKK